MRTTITDYLPLERPLVIFDLETTGLTAGEDRIIEIAYEKILPSGEIVASAQRINPGMPIPADSTRINGITDEDVKECPSFTKLSYELWSVFEGADAGGFNVLGFDLPFLRGEFSSVGKTFEYAQKRVLDAKILYHKVVPRDNFAPRNLSAAYKLYCGKVHETAHTGAGDVRVTVEILEQLLERHPEFRSWDSITELNGQKKLLESAKTEHAPLVSAAGPATLF
ncbi:MAG: 3'-5' exonuclease [Candidatus Moranbacteria bacterium]|nr:3'-5' exonuclease [Candidatus Moranbacteria bacterium]NTW46428.1 3'-5' exonuclease [Candidatus Moranbacteria bacterium]